MGNYHQTVLRQPRISGRVINLGIGEVHDSRISNLRVIKEIDPETITIYIKPPPKDIVRMW
jgi:predicted amino acid racemase